MYASIRITFTSIPLISTNELPLIDYLKKTRCAKENSFLCKIANPQFLKSIKKRQSKKDLSKKVKQYIKLRTESAKEYENQECTRYGRFEAARLHRF